MRKRSVNVAAANVLTVRKRSASNNNVFSVAKAKRQLQSAWPERKSTTHYDGASI
ncbi:hypothetical protein [Lysinibacillus sphaericus]|uniref:hypothetical protein n=1 Tax=Lysinibacillus sphaericus TaxID=1421 RepID=UPI0018CF45EA|nr:hypothetical protein [Lysinibacillus sphaericus]